MSEHQHEAAQRPAVNPANFVPVQVVVAGKAFTYKHSTDIGQALSPRDPVIVDFGTKGLTVGIVESVGQVPLDPNAKFQYKWIVDRVDRSRYDAILAAVAGGSNGN